MQKRLIVLGTSLVGAVTGCADATAPREDPAFTAATAARAAAAHAQLEAATRPGGGTGGTGRLAAN